MVFDLNKYADDITNAEYDRIDREWIEDGTHIIKIEACSALTGQNTGRDMIILEGEIVSTDSKVQKAGAKVKHIWSLSGVEKWKVQRNLGQVKSMVSATLPAEVANAVTADIVSKAIDGGRGAVIVAALIKVVAKQKTSKNEKTFLSFSFMRAPTTQTATGWTVVEDVQDEQNSEDVPF